MTPVVLAALLFPLWTATSVAQDSTAVADATLEHAFAAAGDHGAALRAAHAALSATEQPVFRYLLCGMPSGDLASLDAAFLVGEVRLALEARAAAPWGEQLPDEVFLDAVLPYAHVTEKREPWRVDLRARCLPMIEGCTTPGEAARRINERLFREVGVRYSTTRRRADQSPSESIEQGVASCTGLSILLADACRSVGVPARLAGIAEWPGKSGNHTWVEVWDLDGWHFVGAAEPDPKGLDRAWFVGDAQKAVPGDPRHGIWALTWRPTPYRFPLVWARGDGAHAVDVTLRYLPKESTAAHAARLEIDVVDGEKGPRVPARIEILELGEDAAARLIARGVARDERADTNDHLGFDVREGKRVRVHVTFGTRAVDVEVGPTTAEVLRKVVTLPSGAEGESGFRAAATAFFAAKDEDRAKVAFPGEADRFVDAHEAEARAIVDAIWRAAPLWDEARNEFEADLVKTADRQSAYTQKTVGERGPAGFALVIAMHGGGGVPKEVNDSQWRHMQIYYKDHPEAGGYRYVALRAPNDAWNGFYDDAIAPLVERLIRNFVLFGDVDPDRVYAIGYSHGGYGAFVLGPKIPDRFAAVHASASAPSDGETLACNLRNLHFSFMVGGKDTAYGRLDRCNAFDALVKSLREKDPEGYPVEYRMIEGNPHTGLPDRDILPELLRQRRDPVPSALTWQPSDGVLHDQFWLHVDAPADAQHFDLRFEGDRLLVTAPEGLALDVGLDHRLLGSLRSIDLLRDGKTTHLDYAPSARTLCSETLRRGDASLAFPMRAASR
ncbi:MAG: transglutaminase domain-containing protein [Planctomycetota bacterium]